MTVTARSRANAFGGINGVFVNNAEYLSKHTAVLLEGRRQMDAPTNTARHADESVATEQYAKLSRTRRSQYVADGLRSLFRAAFGATSGEASTGSRADMQGTATPATR